MKQTQQFNDGITNIYGMKNIAAVGDLPVYETILKVGSLRYQELKVFDSKFWAAKQDQTKIERLLRVPRIDFVRRSDVVVPIDTEQYEIVQIQYTTDVEPQCMDLSLERLEVSYDIT